MNKLKYSKGSGPSVYQRQLKGKSGSSNTNNSNNENQNSNKKVRSDNSKIRHQGNQIDLKFGFERIKESMSDDSGIEKSAIDLYFIDRAGENFKATVYHKPYFYVDIKDPKRTLELVNHLQKRFEGCFVEVTPKVDLDLPNYLSGKMHTLLKLSFRTVSDLSDAKNELRPIVETNKKRATSEQDEYSTGMENMNGQQQLQQKQQQHAAVSEDPLSMICDMREHDVAYTMRVAIDIDLRVGSWYIVTPEQGSGGCTLSWQKDMLELCEPKVLAFDIECEKAPLKFPNAENDRIYMISYMINGQGYLVINRDIVTEDVPDFEYTPLPKFPGPFAVFNEKDELNMLKKFLEHVQELRPHVIVTYNGDYFDWPFLEARCVIYGLSLYEYLGIKSNKVEGSASVMNSTEQQTEYIGRGLVHLDAFSWVQRDSYLPQGNQGLKAVTRYKLGYDPVEVDPEDMLRFARERPLHMASYSVSDAVATYYLYTTYVHNFIFSLCTIIPLTPEEVLRKGSGTLCEALLMVEAYRGNIICPNKQIEPLEKFHNGHLLEAETYVGGHVECLEAGVFRKDIPVKFNLVSSALQQLIDKIDRDLTFALETEHGIQKWEVTNFEDIKQEVVSKLEMLRDSPDREEAPLIYHLDVGAMYPNIILTNRLQPTAIVSDSTCAACTHNRSESNCKRDMTWRWRGDFSPAGSSDYLSVRRQLSVERINDKPFFEHTEKEQAKLLKDRLKSYSHRVYNKTKITVTEDRVDTVCQRENPVYVNTVRAFRDRRYEYKLLTKKWKTQKIEAEKRGDLVARKLSEDKEILMDSLQLAHKCILNSFYGYVMRKGARWRSMEMAGIVTLTGANLIKQARELVEQVGKPLELDTDGIWCVLPSSFPRDFRFTTKSGDKVFINYPCAMLNADVHDRYTNHQYQDLISSGDSPGSASHYGTHSECSIYFELDGPYQAMVLPASAEEGRLLKKKYVVFNLDGSLAELKGFELKRRGELELVKIFQGQVFEQFLKGGSLEDCYQAVGAVGNQWLDVLDNQGEDMADEELMELISERKTISKTLDDYEGRKATSLTTAGRLADFLGQEMVKDKGLNCNLIIARLPAGAPTTERALPVAIFSADPAIRRHYLRRWLKDPTLECEDFRTVVDWEYYKGRLARTIQKIITIPAALQGIRNPCPRVEHPVWLNKMVQERSSGLKQRSIKDMFGKPAVTVQDMRPDSKAWASPNDKKRNRAIDHDLSGASVLDIEDGIRPMFTGSARKGVSKSTITSSLQSELYSNMQETETTGIDHSPVAIEDESPFSNENNTAITDESQAATIGETVIPDNDTSAAGSTTSAPPVILPLGPVDSDTFQIWLEARKAIWSSRRKHHRLAAATSGRRGSAAAAATSRHENTEPFETRKKAMGVTDFLKSAANDLMEGYWQILELQETESPGDLVAWVLTTTTTSATSNTKKGNHHSRDVTGSTSYQLQRITLTVPRRIFINCKDTEMEGGVIKLLGGKRVQRVLPHGHASRFLVEVVLPEKRFMKGEKLLKRILCSPKVEGVYELSIPLLLRAIVTLGSVAAVSREARTTSARNSFHIHELQMVDNRVVPYLSLEDTLQGKIRKIFIYRVVDSLRSVGSNGRGLLSVFIVDHSEQQAIAPEGETGEEGEKEEGGHAKGFSVRAFVWLINPNNSAATALPPFQRLFRRFCQDDSATCRIIGNTVNTMVSAVTLCNEKLAQIASEKRGPTLFIAQGALDGRQWRRLLPALHQYPLVTMPASSEDASFHPLTWQTFVAERALQRFLLFPYWLVSRIKSARFSQIPIGNLGDDVALSMTDVLFARQLQRNRHLLWASGNGSSEISADQNYSNSQTGIWSEQSLPPRFDVCGAYRTTCIKIELLGLTEAALLGYHLLDTSGLMATKTGATGGGVGAGASTSSSLDSAATSAFIHLTSCVTGWRQLADSGNVEAEGLLVSLYRYLNGGGEGGGSLLNDAALLRLIRGLMIQLFHRLLSEFRKLGATIVHADFGYLVIHTDKRDWAAAVEYISFILRTLKSRELFAHLELTVSVYWEQLLWMDANNWAGLILHSDQEKEEAEAKQKEVAEGTKSRKSFSQNSKNNRNTTTAANNDATEEVVEVDENNDNNSLHDESESVRGSLEGEDIDGDEDFSEGEGEGGDEDDVSGLKDVQSCWSIATGLPPASAVYFLQITSEFMLLYRNTLNATATATASTSTDPGKEDTDLSSATVPRKKSSSDSTANQNDISQEKAVAQLRRYVTDILPPYLLQIIDELKHLPNNNNTETDTHRDHTEHRRLTMSPALQFVLAVAQVLSLDPHTLRETEVLRRILLAQLGVKEFSVDLQQTNLLALESSFSLPVIDVICSHCNYCRDLDLLKGSADPTISLSDLPLADTTATKSLCPPCPRCNAAVDVLSLEQRLVREIEEEHAAFFQQDFRCKQTRMVSVKMCSSTSEFCSPLEMDIPPIQIQKRLHLLQLAAVKLELVWLEEVLQNLSI